AGFPFDRLPGDLQEAVLLLLRSNLSKLQNPAGAVSVKMGERQVVYRSNNALYDNQLEAEACQLLDNGYVRKSHRRA
ncbi:MAG: hypothetical protein J2P36_39155, partial [Ktedonobacteraceae bacterium]|nr:hypothetical protein [Ktedonobacteraceae bacterium]